MTFNFNEPRVVHAHQISILESLKYLENKTPRGSFSVTTPFGMEKGIKFHPIDIPLNFTEHEEE